MYRWNVSRNRDDSSLRQMNVILATKWLVKGTAMRQGTVSLPTAAKATSRHYPLSPGETKIVRKAAAGSPNPRIAPP